MKILAQTIRDEVDKLATRMLNVPEQEADACPAPGKWSKKEILGHLADSAHNNIRRLVCAQYQDRPNIIYHQDEWVQLQHYSQYRWADLVAFWQMLNLHLAHVLEYLPETSEARLCDTGKDTPELHSLGFLAHDYLAHLRHHTQQILHKRV